MINNFKRGKWVETVSYEVRFYFDSTGGFAFPCDENGNLLTNKIKNPAAIENYKWCLENKDKFHYYFNQVVQVKSSYRENNTGTCHCGNHMELYNEYLGACECPKCHQWYNIFGQELKNPETWPDGDDW